MADLGLALPELEFDLICDEADGCNIGELVNDEFEYLLSLKLGPLVVGLKHALGVPPPNGLNTELLVSGNESDEKLALAKNLKSGGLEIPVLVSFVASPLFIESEWNLGDSISLELELESILEISSSSSSSTRLYEIEFRSILQVWP